MKLSPSTLPRHSRASEIPGRRTRRTLDARCHGHDGLEFVGGAHSNPWTAPVRVFREPQARSRARSETGKMREIGRIVDIQGEAGEAHDRRTDAACLGRREVRKE